MINYGGNMKSCIKFISFTLLFLSMFVSKAWAEKVTVITPYLAQPGTQMYVEGFKNCLLYTSPSPRDLSTSRMPSSA